MTLNERALCLVRQMIAVWDGPARSKADDIRRVIDEMRQVARLADSIDNSLRAIHLGGEPDPAEIDRIIGLAWKQSKGDDK